MRNGLQALAAVILAWLWISPVAEAQQVVPISNLPTAASPLTGSEYVPCVQGGVTKKCITNTFIPTAASVAAAQGYTSANKATFAAASDYGVSTSNTDNSAAFNAIDAAGRVAHLAPGVYKVANTITWTHSGSGLICDGGMYLGVYPTLTPNTNSGCWLQWTGANGGTLWTIAAPLGSTSYGRLSGNVVRGINVDGNNGLLANGILTYSLMYADFDDLFFQNLNGGTAFSIDIVQATTLNFGEHASAQFNKVSHMTTAVNGGACGSCSYRSILLNTWQGSTVGGNASFNYLDNLNLTHAAQDAIDVVGGDNNIFMNVVTYHQGATSSYAIRFSMYQSPGDPYPANANLIIHWSGNEPIHADGQDAVAGCNPWYNGLANNSCTYGNEIVSIDHSNASPEPTFGTGAQLWWSENSGDKGGFQATSPLIVADNQNWQGQGVNAISNRSLFVASSTNSYIGLNNESGCDWTIGSDGANDVKLFNNGSCGTSFGPAALAAPFLLTSVYTYASIPKGPVQTGTRAFVTDAPSCTFGATLSAGGGSTACPVYWNGGAWIEG